MSLINTKTIIESFDKNYQIEIFKIISKYKINYTENDNGIFINMKNINDECLKEINNYISFVNDNKSNDLKFEQIKNETKLKLNPT